MKKIGLFPGSFKNFHLGYIDIIKKALKVLDHLYLVVAINKDKKNDLNDNYQRALLYLADYDFKNLTVIKTNKKIPIVFDELKCTHIIRGIRNKEDFQYEKDLIDAYKKMNPKIEGLFFLAEKQYENLSSSSKALFVFDIDGTLLNDDKKVLPSTKRAIEQLIYNGHEVVLNTGRAYKTVLPIAKALAIPKYLITSGGSIFYDLKNKQINISQKTIPRKDLQLIIDLAQKYRRELIWNNGENIFRVYFGNSPKKEIQDPKYFNAGAYKNPRYDKWDDVKHTIYDHIVHISFKAEQWIIEKEIANIKKAVSKESVCLETAEVYIDVLNKANSKFQGLETIFGKEYVRSKNVYAFGDSENDLDMITNVANGIAMGNARPVVKDAAKKVIGDHNSDAIYNFLVEEGYVHE
ncbi:MAG: Cof-type HAD-IIB family hydrolase [Mycoplasmoidaceae bacterium]